MGNGPPQTTSKRLFFCFPMSSPRTTPSVPAPPAPAHPQPSLPQLAGFRRLSAGLDEAGVRIHLPPALLFSVYTAPPFFPSGCGVRY